MKKEIEDLTDNTNELLKIWEYNLKEKNSKQPRKQSFKMRFEVEYELELTEYENRDYSGVRLQPKVSVKKTDLVKNFDEHFLENYPLKTYRTPEFNKSIHELENEFKEKSTYFEKHLSNHLKKVFSKLSKQFEDKKKYPPAYDFEAAYQQFVKNVRKALKQLQDEGKKPNLAKVANIIYKDRTDNHLQQLKRDFETYSLDYNKFKEALKETR